MRHKILILLSVLLLLPTACGDNINDSALIEAEHLAQFEPDSAKVALMEIDTLRLNKDERMLWRLLRLEVADKLYETHTDDKEIRSLLEYFIDGNRVKRIHPLLYYYAGRVYTDLEEDAKALRYFKNAAKTIKEGEDLDLEDRIQAQLGYLYMGHRLYDHAMRHIRKGIEYAEMRKDTVVVIGETLVVADIYIARHEPDSAFMVYKNLEKMVSECRDSVTRTTYYTQLAYYYNRYRSPEEADSILKIAPIVFDKVSSHSVKLISQRVARALNKGGWDEELYKDMLKSPEPGIRYQGATLLAESRESKGDIKGMLHYTRQAMIYVREQQNKFNKTTLAEMEKIIDDADLENENLKLTLANQRKQILILLIAGVALMAIVGSVAMVARSRMKRISLALEIERLKSDNSHKVAALEREIEEIKRKGETAPASNQDSVGLEERLSLARISERIVNNLVGGEEEITEEDFICLQEAMRLTDPGFIEALDGLDLKPKDYHDALLSKLGVPQKVCAIYFGVTPPGMANSRKRLLQKIDPEGKFRNWKEFIDSL